MSGWSDGIWTKPEYAAADAAYNAALEDDANDRMSALACAVDAALASALSTPCVSGLDMGEGWQDIETAPKDGTAIDLWLVNPALQSGGDRCTDVIWHEDKWREHTEWDEDDDRSDPDYGYLWVSGFGPTSPVETSLVKASHWRPLPAPPLGKDEQ